MLFVRLNKFHVANDLSTRIYDGSVERQARRDEEEGPAGVSGMATRKEYFDSFQSRGEKITVIDLKNVTM